MSKKNTAIPLNYNKMSCDTDKSFEAFALYRDMGPSRSCSKVADTLQKQEGNIRNWCYKNQWVARVALWDDDLDRRATRQELLDREATALRHLRATRRQQRIAERELNKHERLSKSLPDDAPLLDADKASKMENDAIKLERLIHGDPTERSDNSGSLNLSLLDTDEILILKALIVKASKTSE